MTEKKGFRMGVIEELQLKLFEFKYDQQGFYPVSISSGIYSQC